MALDCFLFHELIAGPLSAGRGQSRPLDSGLNPQSLLSLGGIDNFGEVVVDHSGLTVRILDTAVRGGITLSPR